LSLERYWEYLERVTTSPHYWHEGAVIEFTEDLQRRMEEQNVSRAELARRMGTSRAYITRLLGGDANFTLMTMVKLSMAVGGALHVHISDQQATTRWQDTLPGEKAHPEILEEAEAPPRRKRVAGK
jgi:transcriptional regulator with XRE-family HTH domain